MIDYANIRRTIVKGLSDYLQCPVIRANQTAEMPPYPFVSYTITTLVGQNNGTYGEYEDGIYRKPVTQTWSISALSSDNEESVTLAVKAREWLDHIGTTFLSDNNVIVQSVGNITNRDNILTVEYEYKNGFDIVLSMFDEIGETLETDGIIDAVQLGDKIVEKPDYEAKIAELEKELNEATLKINNLTNQLNEAEKVNIELEQRLKGEVS